MFFATNLSNVPLLSKQSGQLVHATSSRSASDVRLVTGDHLRCAALEQFAHEFLPANVTGRPPHGGDNTQLTAWEKTR